MLTINSKNNHILWGGCIVVLPNDSYKLTARTRNLGKGKQRKVTQTKLTVTNDRLLALLEQIEREFLRMPIIDCKVYPFLHSDSIILRQNLFPASADMLVLAFRFSSKGFHIESIPYDLSACLTKLLLVHELDIVKDVENEICMKMWFLIYN